MQPFHRIGFTWPNDCKLVIEWLGGSEGEPLEPPTASYFDDCRQELELGAIGRQGVPAICWRPTDDSLFEPMQLRENTEYLIDATLPIDLDEANEAWKADKSWPLTTVRNAYESDPPRRWQFHDGFVTVTGRLNFRSYVGAAELALPGIEPLILEVVCTKIGYFDDFRQLLDAIAEEYAMLLLEIESPTFARFTVNLRLKRYHSLALQTVPAGKCEPSWVQVVLFDLDFFGRRPGWRFGTV